jgi:hypothetical protein
MCVPPISHCNILKEASHSPSLGMQRIDWSTTKRIGNRIGLKKSNEDNEEFSN